MWSVLFSFCRRILRVSKQYSTSRPIQRLKLLLTKCSFAYFPWSFSEVSPQLLCYRVFPVVTLPCFFESLCDRLIFSADIDFVLQISLLRNVLYQANYWFPVAMLNLLILTLGFVAQFGYQYPNQAIQVRQFLPSSRQYFIFTSQYFILILVFTVHVVFLSCLLLHGPLKSFSSWILPMIQVFNLLLCSSSCLSRHVVFGR